MKSVILFEDLDKFNYYFSFFLIPFFKKIYFAEASFAQNQSFFKKKINKIYFQIGLKDQSGRLIQRAFSLKKYLIKKVLKKNFQSYFFLNFSKLINLNNENLKKLIITFENKIFQTKFESIETKSYIYIKKNFKNKTFYFPSSQNSLLIMNEIINDKLKIISLLVLIKIFFSNLKILFQKKLKRYSVNQKIGSKINIGINKPEIGYFPHGGIKYGNFFKKNFFYHGSKDSFLYKDNIDTISFNKFDKLTIRYLNFCKLKNTELGNLPLNLNFKKTYLFLNFFLKNRKYVFKNKILLFKIFFELYLSINKFNNFFKGEKYKFLYFDNDSIIPSGFLLSANINHIKTISLQDRLISYMYNHKCFFDLYLISGIRFKKIFQTKYNINHYETLGLTRVDLIKKKPLKRIDAFLKNKRGIITCLLLSPNTDWRVNLNGEDGTSIKSNLNFCSKIAKLSNSFQNYNFIIKFKILDTVKDKFIIDSINQIIEPYQNIFLEYDDKILSSNLVAHSRLVIGKYSTILDETLVSGVDVIIDDEEEFISHFSFFKKNKFHIVKNFNDLFLKSKYILNDNEPNFLNYKNNKITYINNYLTNQGKVGSAKKIMEIIEKFMNKSKT